MKQLYTLLALSILLVACKNDKKEKISEIKTSKKEAPIKKVIPTATFKSETLDLTHCESAVYDEESDIIYASLIGNTENGDGAIATISLNGEVINPAFVAGLNDPKGIAITKERIYVSDVTELVEADIETGKILNRYTNKETAFLNDVAIGDDGSVYVSDTRTSKIFVLHPDGKFNVWMDNPALDNPNGLLIQGNTMYVACWGGAPEGGRVLKIDMAKQIPEQMTKIIGNLDGIVPFDEDHLLISDWSSGKIHVLNYDTGATEDIVTVGESVGDIAYIKDKNLLLLPMNRQSRLLFYNLK